MEKLWGLIYSKTARLWQNGAAFKSLGKESCEIKGGSQECEIKGGSQEMAARMLIVINFTNNTTVIVKISVNIIAAIS